MQVYFVTVSQLAFLRSRFPSDIATHNSILLASHCDGKAGERRLKTSNAKMTGMYYFVPCHKHMHTEHDCSDG